MKYCSKCDRTLQKSNFYKRKLRHGNYGLRSHCKECMDKSSAKWAKENPESRSKYSARWYKKNAQHCRDVSAAWKRNNPEKVAAYKEKNKHRWAGYAATWREKHPEKARLWARNNPEARRVIGQRYRARKRNLPHTLTDGEWNKTLDAFEHKCAYCGEPWEHQDHLIPVIHNGGYTAINMVPACARCNKSKGGKLPLDWMSKEMFYEVLQTIPLIERQIGDIHSEE